MLCSMECCLTSFRFLRKLFFSLKKLRDDLGICRCMSGPASKLARIDPELRSEWEKQWAQAQAQALSSGSDHIYSGELLLNTEEFECRICFCSIPPHEGVILRECFHIFCKDCLAATVKHCEETRVKCPHQINEYICTSFLTSGEIKAVGLFRR